MRVDRPTPTEAREQLRAWRAESLPITGWQRSLFVHRGRALSVPVLQVDARGRPDVVDLLRVHRLVGPEGDVSTDWAFFWLGQPPIRAFLNIKYERPVRCSFRLAFRFARHQELLEAIAAAALSE
jgi:hypothetical protein